MARPGGRPVATDDVSYLIDSPCGGARYSSRSVRQPGLTPIALSRARCNRRTPRSHGYVMSRRAVLACLILGVACAGDATAPSNGVVGRFGGRATELVASVDRVRVQFACGSAVFEQPIITEPDGRFSLAPVLVSTRNGTAALAIKGIVNSDQIAFDAVSLSPAGEVTTSHYVVHLNQTADYSGLACLADGDD